MSNCIMIHMCGTLVLSEDDIDQDRLWEFLTHAASFRQAPRHLYEQPDGDTLGVNTAWWFLVPGENVKRVGYTTVVRLGEGNSTHTWRDLKGTLWVLGRFLRRPIDVVLTLSDESDGFASRCRCLYRVVPGHDVVNGPIIEEMGQ